MQAERDSPGLEAGVQKLQGSWLCLIGDCNWSWVPWVAVELFELDGVLRAAGSLLALLMEALVR